MFRTLDDLKKENNQDKKDKKTTDFYTGGEKSGLAVEGGDDNIQGILKKAQENSKGKRDNDSRETPEHTCKITLYRNGFMVDDGPFRNYTDPPNKKFMDELNKNHVPEELRSKYPKGLKVGISNRTKRDYELPPPPKYVAFSGSGMNLTAAQSPTKNEMHVEQDIKPQPPKVDNNKPRTRIMVRLHNGKTEEVEVNYDTQVSDVFTYVWSLTPSVGEFELIAGFPPKPITNVNQTIEEAGLEDSKIIQKLL